MERPQRRSLLVKVTTRQLLSVLSKIATLVEDGDTYEGGLEYRATETDEWEVDMYRYGSAGRVTIAESDLASSDPTALGDTTAPYGTVVVDDPDAGGAL
jgi:hypothetical protein